MAREIKQGGPVNVSQAKRTCADGAARWRAAH
jgi:hypothetical protein